MERLRYTVYRLLPALLIIGLAALALITWSRTSQPVPIATSPNTELPTPPALPQPPQPPHLHRAEPGPLPAPAPPFAPGHIGERSTPWFSWLEGQAQAVVSWLVGTPLQWLAVGLVLISIWLLQHTSRPAIHTVEQTEHSADRN